jgi:hypothetical protein
MDTTSLRKLRIFFGSTVNALLKDRFGLDSLKLSLEVFQTCGIAAAIGTTTSIVQVETFVLDFFAIDTPLLSQ